MKKSIYKFFLFRLMGWKIEGSLDAGIKKCILMVAPHTSWQDFYLGIFARGIIGLEMNFLGKKELFCFPIGYYFRWMGGAPITRTGGLNKVDDVAKTFENHHEFRLAISPEGTRKKVSVLKTGFYYIALKVNVPIIPVAFDFGKKVIRIGKPLLPSGNIENDFTILLKHFKGVVGKIPEYSFNPE